jgi:TonB family protein
MTGVGEPLFKLIGVQQFAVEQVGSRLASDPDLVARFWAQIATAGKTPRPDLTVFYSLVRWQGEVFALLEFVAGETLEDLVKRCEPSACEKEIPLFCRVLDAFEGEAVKSDPAALTALELLDFGIRRISAPTSGKLHGAMLAGPEGLCGEEIFGGSDVDRSSARAQLSSLWRELSGEPEQRAAPATVQPARRSRRALPPVLIAIGTAMLVLLMLFGIGGFLAKRTAPANSGKLALPPFPNAPPEVPIQPTPQAAIDAALAAAEPKPAPRKRSTKQPTATIILARGARPIRQTKLQYPEAARKERISGVVEMQLTIAEDGSVQNPRVLSGDPLLRAGLAEEVAKWIYEPMRVNGKPAPMTTELAIRFNLSP